MGLLARAIASPFRFYNSIADEVTKERRLRLTDAGGWASLVGRESNAGKRVTLDSALQLGVVWACIRTTTQAFAALPGAMFEKQRDDSRVRIDDDPIGMVVCDSPNEDQTALEFWESQVGWLLANGNAYAEQVAPTGRLLALQPIAANACMPFRKADGELFYRISDRGQQEELPRNKVFHVKGFGQGLIHRDLGLSPIAYGTHSLGAAMAADEVAAKMFANGIAASGVLSMERALDEPQRKQLGEMMEKFAGSSRAGKILVLESAAKYQPITINPEDAQLLGTRRHSVEDICRWYGVPPIVIGHAGEGQTMWGTGVEQIMIAWLMLGIDPLADRIEACIKKQLIRPTGQRRRYVEFNREALLQMDSKSKAAFLSSMVQNALMTRNEARAKLNLRRDESPVADQLTAQTNLAPLDRLGAEGDGNQVRAAMRSWLGVVDPAANPEGE